jgi:hypothetical protein
MHEIDTGFAGKDFGKIEIDESREREKLVDKIVATTKELETYLGKDLKGLEPEDAKHLEGLLFYSGNVQESYPISDDEGKRIERDETLTSSLRRLANIDTEVRGRFGADDGQRNAA